MRRPYSILLSKNRYKPALVGLVFCLLLAFLLMGTEQGVAEEERIVPVSQAGLQQSFAPVVKKTVPAVVNIYARQIVRNAPALFNDPFFQQFFGGALQMQPRVQNSLGSGVIVNGSGLVVTNNHVIANGDQIKVVLADGREYAAKVLLKDEKMDLAVLKIDAGNEVLPFLPMGDEDSLQVGDLVLAIGNPFGVGQTVTSGIVSALARTNVGISDYGFFIQTDAAINPGNSGGALVDLNGRLVGVPTAIFSRSGGSIGIGFAIPVSMVKSMLHAAQNGQVRQQPWLGAYGQTVTFDLAQTLELAKPGGVLLGDVRAGSPAASAGLREGDVILRLGNHEVTDAESLRYRLATLSIGGTVPVQYWRDGDRDDTTLQLIAAPEVPAREVTTLGGQNPLSGAVIANINPAVIEELRLSNNAQGVVILMIPQGVTAAQVGLQPADIIASLNGTPLPNVAALKAMMHHPLQGFDVVLVRGNQKINLAVR